ncbi:MAG TPA: response regulator transcription factor [Kofleriaceae bacterium]|nr:response regulator transcription factor [Kofleriaceae bacterium]
MIRVLIVSDRALVRSGLRRMLEGAPEVVVTGEASAARDASGPLGEMAPSVILVDFAMPLQHQLEAISELVRQAGPGRVLVLGGHADRQHAQRAIEAGASGFLWQGADVAELLEAIRTVHSGTTYLSPQLVAPPRIGNGRSADDPVGGLSKREIEVLCFLASGMTNREIAHQLGISVKTIDTHRGHVLKKLQLRNNSDITRFAIRHGFVRA